MIVTWSSGKIRAESPGNEFFYLDLQEITSTWSEGLSARPALRVSATGLVVSQIIPGQKLTIDTLQITKRHLLGSPNFGLALSRQGTYGTLREEGTLEGAPRLHSREATDPNVRPYLEVVIDTSRPRYPAPTDSPQGLSLASSLSSVTASWSGTPANTESVRVEINCSSSGIATTTVAATTRSFTRSNLRPGERCSARAASINDGGSSPLSMSTAEVVVAGTAPASAPSSRLAIASSQATVTVSGIASDATEVQVTLTCTQSGQRNATIQTSQTTATFTGLTTGESCSASSVARNAWGSSPQGQISNSELVRGQAPSAMSFISESVDANQIRISWSSTPANTSTVDLVLTCQTTGRISRSLSPNDRQAVISDLKASEQCTPSLTLTNQWGSSPTTTNPAVVVKGSAPTAPSIENIDLQTPQQVVVTYLLPTGATSVDLYLRCSQAGTNSLLGIPSSRNSATFTNAIAGDRCSISAQAKNEWGTSNQSSSTTQFIVQGPKPDAPSDAQIKSEIQSVEVTWNNGSGASQTQVTLECTRSGSRRYLVNTPSRTQKVSAIPGELCNATLISKNQWGDSTSGVRTQSVTVKSPVVQTPNEPRIATPTPREPTIRPAPTPTRRTNPATPAPKATAQDLKTITCIKGAAQQNVTAKNPKCPKGWIKKPVITRD